MCPLQSILVPTLPLPLLLPTRPSPFLAILAFRSISVAPASNDGSIAVTACCRHCVVSFVAMKPLFNQTTYRVEIKSLKTGGDENNPGKNHNMCLRSSLGSVLISAALQTVWR